MGPFSSSPAAWCTAGEPLACHTTVLYTAVQVSVLKMDVDSVLGADGTIECGGAFLDLEGECGAVRVLFVA